MSVSRPLIPLLVGLVSGISLGAARGGLSVWAAVLLAVSLADVAYRLYRQRDGRLSPLLLFAALGYLAIQPWLSPRLPSHHVSRYIGSHPWQISGTIISEPFQQKHLQKFVLQAESLLDVGRGRVDVVGKLRVTVSGLERGLQRGERIALRGRIRAVRGFENPDAFDYERYLAYRGIWATAYAQGKHVSQLAAQPGGKLSDVVDAYRRRIAELIERGGRPEQQAVLKALVIGDRSLISHELRQAFQRAGVGHLLAISGLHIGIVATVAFAFLRWVLGFVRPLLWRAWLRPTAAVVAMLPVIAYGMISGWAASTQRAVLMVSVFLAGFLVRREQDAINTLAFAALLILIVSPPTLFSISFQLSFAAVWFILCGLGRTSRQPRQPGPAPAPNMIRRLTRQVGTLMRVSGLAIGGTLPLVMAHFNQVSLAGIVTNVILVPLVGFTVVPVGLLAAFVAPIHDQLALGCLAVCHAFLIPALAIVRGFSQLPFGALYTITPSPVEIACYYVLLWAILNVRTTGRPGSTALAAVPSRFAQRLSEHTDQGRWIQRLWTLPGYKLARYALALSVLVLAVDGLYWMHRRFWHEDMRVTIVDVGQGTANLVELPGGSTMLIDGGGFADNSIFDVGAQIIAPLLWRQKIGTVDTLVLSHPDSDHVNGLIFIAEHFNVKTIWLNGEARRTRGYLDLLEVAAARNIVRPRFRTLDRNRTIHGVRISVLYPPPDFLDRVAAEKWRTPNNNSLVVKIAYGDVSFLFPGDIMQEAEAELVRMAGPELASTVLIAPHHGSRTSNSACFLEAVRPQVVVFSCGHAAAVRLPHPQVLVAYAGLNARLYQTARHGAVCISTDGRRVTVDPVVSDGVMPD